MSETPRAGAWMETEKGSRVPLGGGNFSIGREPGNDLVLDGGNVSRHHAIIRVQDNGEYWLADLGSSNGTFLDGRCLLGPTLLHYGARVRIGDFQCVFRQVRSPLAHRVADDPQVTVRDIQVAHCWFVIADIEGYSALTQSLPPEQLGRVVGVWVSECHGVIDRRGGVLNKFLGDGFFAYWPDNPAGVRSLKDALDDFLCMQACNDPRFRLVVHRGLATFSGSLGGEVIIGTDVHFAFRMEKLAKNLGLNRLGSAPAREGLKGLTFRGAGRHPLPGFDGRHEFFTW